MKRGETEMAEEEEEIPSSFTKEMGIVTEGKMGGGGGGGCINGLLHFFERRYFFSGRRGSSHCQKKNQKKTLLLTGEPAVVVNKGVGLQRKTESRNIQQHKPVEPSTPSSSTSSCSSPFSSTDSYKTALPATPFPLQTVSPRSPAKLPRRFSFDGVDAGDVPSRTRFGIKDLPRLSLGSREDSGFRLSSTSASPPALRKSAAAGPLLPPLPEPEPGSGKRPSNLVAKLMGLDPDDLLLHVGPTSPLGPIVRAEMGPGPEVRAGPNVLSEIEKKLADVHFRNSSGNLRALQQIIENMRRTKARDNMVISPKYGEGCRARTEGQNSKSTSPRRNQQLRARDGSGKFHNPPVRRSRPVSSHSPKDSSRLKVESSPDRPVKPARAGARPSTKRRLYPRPFQPDTSRTKSRDYNKITILPLAKEENDPLFGKIKNKSRIKIKSGEKDEVLSSELKGMTLAEVGTVSDAIDQPSPVSVLDPLLYGDDLPSPPKMVNVRPPDDWEESSSDVLWSPLESEQVKLEVDSANDDDADDDRGYVREILSASGLLHGDPDPDTEVVRLDPGVFRLLERTRRRGCRTAEMDRTARRRLVFDVVGEIVTRMPAGAWSRICGLGLEEHVKVVCGEMEGMRARTADVEVCDDVTGGVEKRVEVSRVVLSIERMIFKDLVDEIVKGDELGSRAAGVQGRLCRRLFSAVDFGGGR